MWPNSSFSGIQIQLRESQSRAKTKDHLGYVLKFSGIILLDSNPWHAI